MRESATNDSMLKNFDEEISVTIDSDGVMLEYEAENEVVRGGVEKEDSEMGTTPQGNSSFAGIEFEWSVHHQPRGGGRPDLRRG